MAKSFGAESLGADGFAVRGPVSAAPAVGCALVELGSNQLGWSSAPVALASDLAGRVSKSGDVMAANLQVNVSGASGYNINLGKIDANVDRVGVKLTAPGLETQLFLFSGGSTCLDVAGSFNVRKAFSNIPLFSVDGAGGSRFDNANGDALLLITDSNTPRLTSIVSGSYAAEFGFGTSPYVAAMAGGDFKIRAAKTRIRNLADNAYAPLEIGKVTIDTYDSVSYRTHLVSGTINNTINVLDGNTGGYGAIGTGIGSGGGAVIGHFLANSEYGIWMGPLGKIIWGYQPAAGTKYVSLEYESMNSLKIIGSDGASYGNLNSNNLTAGGSVTVANTVRLDSGRVRAGLFAGYGYSTLMSGSTGNTGYVEWWKPNGSRSCYMGYDSGNDLSINFDSGGKLVVNGQFAVNSSITQGTSDARWTIPATGKRTSELGNGAGVWQTGFREEYNAAGVRHGFFGATPIGRPSLAAAATDAATTQTLANSLRSALINLGLGA